MSSPEKITSDVISSPPARLSNVTEEGMKGKKKEQVGSASKYDVVEKETPTSSEKLRFLLLGETRSGKSSTGNTILGANLFSVDLTFWSVPEQCELRENVHLGRNVEIMDTPGLRDMWRSEEDIWMDIMKAVASMHPGPHAILYVIPLYYRYTEEEYAVYTHLKALFGDHMTRYIIVLFTGGDDLSPGQNMEQIIQMAPNRLHEVLDECGNRYVVFNNMSPNPSQQVQHLFSLVDRMNRNNGGQPYQCPRYTTVVQKLGTEMRRRRAQEKERELERTHYGQAIRQQTEYARKVMESKAAREVELRRENTDVERIRRMFQKMFQEERMLREYVETERPKLRTAELWEEIQREMLMLEDLERRELKNLERGMEMMSAQRKEALRRQERRDRQNPQLMETDHQIASTSGSEGGGFFGGILGVANYVVDVFKGLFGK